jgi:hypothetical protein
MQNKRTRRILKNPEISQKERLEAGRVLSYNEKRLANLIKIYDEVKLSIIEVNKLISRISSTNKL